MRRSFKFGCFSHDCVRPFSGTPVRVRNFDRTLSGGLRVAATSGYYLATLQVAFASGNFFGNDFELHSFHLGNDLGLRSFPAVSDISLVGTIGPNAS